MRQLESLDELDVDVAKPRVVLRSHLRSLRAGDRALLRGGLRGGGGLLGGGEFGGEPLVQRFQLHVFDASGGNLEFAWVIGQ